jgi:hypothetical protein
VPGSGWQAAPVCSSGAWRPLGTGGLTWQDEGRPAEAAQGGGRGSKATRGRGEGGAGLQQLGKRPAAVDHARAAEAEEIGDPRKKTRADLQNLKSARTALQSINNF